MWKKEERIFALSTAYKITIMIPLISLSGLQILEFLSSPGDSQSSGGWTPIRARYRGLESKEFWGEWLPLNKDGVPGQNIWQALSILEIWKHENLIGDLIRKPMWNWWLFTWYCCNFLSKDFSPYWYRESRAFECKQESAKRGLWEFHPNTETRGKGVEIPY